MGVWARVVGRRARGACALVMVCALLLAACGGEDEADPTAPTEPTVETVEDATPDTAATPGTPEGATPEASPGASPPVSPIAVFSIASPVAVIGTPVAATPVASPVADGTPVAAVGRPAVSASPVVAVPMVEGVPVFGGDPARTGEQPGPGPAIAGMAEQTFPYAGPRPVLRWQLPVGNLLDYAYSAPIVVAGTLYATAADGFLYAVEAETGQTLWSFPTGDEAAVVAPAFADGRVYAAGAGGTLVAVDAATGAEQWRYQAPDAAEPDDPVVAAGGTVYYSLGPSLIAVDAATGEEQWRFDSGGAGRVSAPAIAGEVVYVGTGGDAAPGALVALDATDGTELWRFTGSEETAAAGFSAPTVAEGIIFVRSTDAVLYAVDSAGGELLWPYSLPGGDLLAPSVVNGTIYVGNGTNLFAIDAVTGATRWTFSQQSLAEAMSCCPAVADGTVYLIMDGDDLYAIDAETSDVEWVVPVAPGASSPVVIGGTVYVGSEGGLFAFAAPASSAIDAMDAPAGTPAASS